MSPIIALTFQQYMHAYKRYASEFWGTMDPMQYGALLIFVFVCGFLLLRSGTKL